MQIYSSNKSAIGSPFITMKHLVLIGHMCPINTWCFIPIIFIHIYFIYDKINELEDNRYRFYRYILFSKENKINTCKIILDVYGRFQEFIFK